MTRIQPWTEAQLMDREQRFEALTAKAVDAVFASLAKQMRRDVLTAAVELPGAPPETAPPVSFTTLENAVMATWTGLVDSQLYPFLVDTFADSAGAVVDGVQTATGFAVEQLTNVYAQDFLAYAQNRMVGIGEDLWLKIRDELSAGFAAGEGIKEMASRLEDVAHLSTPRALTTARTEVISAANAGSYLQMLHAGFEEKVTKVWLATEDPRTRKSHRHADNQGVELTGEFAVDIYSGDVKTGQEFLEFPGDPSGTPGNIINCRCSLAFDFDEGEVDQLLTADGFIEIEHPRDKDGKFKKKGAPDLYMKVPDAKPSNSAPAADKVAWMLAHKWDSMTGGQKAVLINNIDSDTWKKLPPALKGKVIDAPSGTSHPEIKIGLEKAVENLGQKIQEGAPKNVKEQVEDLVKNGLPAPAAGKTRELGGKDTKTGKPLVPGKPVKLRVQLLYNTTFADGAVMAVRKDSGERIVWQDGKVKRQKLGADGKYSTTDTKTRGDAYKAWKDEDGWTVPDASTASPEAAAAPSAPAAVGKPVALKVQLIYQTPFNDGDTVAVKPSTGEKITWDAGKKRMVVHAADGSTTEYTRGALYKAYKDETGWHLPGGETTPEAAPASAPAMAETSKPDPVAPKKFAPPAKSALPKAKPLSPALSEAEKAGTPAAPVAKSFTPVKMLSPETNQAMKDAVQDPAYGDGTILFQENSNTIVKTGHGKAELTHVSATGSGTAEIGLDDWNTSKLINKALLAQDKSKVQIGNIVPQAIQSNSLIITDENVDAIKDLFNDPNVQINDLLFENPDLEIEKLTDDQVMVTHKQSGNFTGKEIDDLTADWLDDFVDNLAGADSNDPVIPAIVSTEAYLIHEAYQKSNGGVLHSDADIDINKSNVSGKLILTENGPPWTTGVLKPDDVTPENIDKAIAAVKAGKDFSSSQPIPEVGEAENGAPGGSGGVSAGETAVDIATAANNVDQDDIAGLSNVFVDPSSGLNVLKAGNGNIGITKDGSPGFASIEGYITVTPEQIQKALDALDSGNYSTGTPYKDINGFLPQVPPTPSAGVGAVAAARSVGAIPKTANLKATGQSLGTHGGKVYKDSVTGQDWLFKPAPYGFKASADVDLATTKLHDLLGLPTPPLGVVEINGQTGSLQKILPGSVVSPTNFKPKNLSASETIAIQKEHIFDWLVANHDAHSGNLLKTPDGDLVGIDKGQAFKWLGQDKLDVNFKPNEHPQAANVLYKAFGNGESNVMAYNPATTPELKDFIDKIQAIPDADYKAILRPYAEKAAAEGKLGVNGPSHLGLTPSGFPSNNVEAFLDAAVARKNQLAAQIQAFYDQALSKHNASVGTASPINPPTTSVPSQIPGQIPTKQVPIKLGHSVLVGPKSTKYQHGQLIAENPGAGERLYWNAQSKKFVVQAQGSDGKWKNAYSYNKQAALANLKDDAGWVTPSTPFIFADAGNTPGQAAVPTISGQTSPLEVHNLPEVDLSQFASAPPPKISVADLQKQADDLSGFTEQKKNYIYTMFRSKGTGGGTQVRLNSDPKDMFEALLEAQSAFNSVNMGSPASLLQILRTVDAVAAGKAAVTNNNAYENKIVSWLQTEAGLKAVQNINSQLTLSPEGKKATLFNKILGKFKKTQEARLSATAAWQKVEDLQPGTPKVHTPGDTYPQIMSKSAGSAFGKEMEAKYGKLAGSAFQAMKKYTGNSYTVMNSFMRSFGKSNTEQADSVLAAQKGMKPAVRNLLVHRNSGTVFDASWQPSVAELQSFVGKVFREDAFASTSIDGSTFNGHKYRFIIEVPEGTPIAWVEDFSMNQGEKEFLLGAGLKYEILEVTGPIDGPWASTASKTAVIRMRIVP